MHRLVGHCVDNDVHAVHQELGIPMAGMAYCRAQSTADWHSPWSQGVQFLVDGIDPSIGQLEHAIEEAANLHRP